MPPANSRAASPPDESSPTRSEPSPSFLAVLRELENPVSSSVLNIAATLTTTPEDDVAAENLRFLRTPVDPQEEWRAENAQERLRERLRRTAEQRSEDRERRERLQRVLNRLSRIHEPPSYGDRIPTQNNLYDWSPSNAADDEEDEPADTMMDDLRQQRPRPYAHTDVLRHDGHLRNERDARSRSHSSRTPTNNSSNNNNHNTTSSSSSSSSSSTTTPATTNPHNNNNNNNSSSSQPPQPPDGSLRSAAILQSVRRHPRFSARSREYMQRYMTDRDTTSSSSRDAQGGEGRERTSPTRTSSSLASGREPGRYDQNRRNWLAEQSHMEFLDRTRTSDERDYWRSRIDSYRRTFDNQPAASASPSPSRWLEHTIRYLSRLRTATSYDDSLSYALDAGFVTKEFFGDNHEDFLLDLGTLPPIAETSWLRPGAVLSGSQHATSVTSAAAAVSPTTTTTTSMNTTLYRFRNNESMTSTTIDSSRPWLRDTYVPPHARRSSDSFLHTPSQDRWPVKVAIHSVDYEKMSLTATMEAYNVPSQPSSGVFHSSMANAHLTSSRTSSITTYLEGEILDFRTHTFLTESFKSDALNDASYWRMLPPFSSFPDDELVRNLVSRQWLIDHLCNEYVLMRWKERCFVRNGRSSSSSSHNSNNPNNGSHWDEDSGSDDEEESAEDGCGLTISGFYYVCLRRSDGAVEGLYCDPQSSPYQHLRLRSVGGGVFPVWEFR